MSRLLKFSIFLSTPLLLIVMAASEASAEVNSARLINCYKKDSGLCRFYYKSDYVELRNKGKNFYKFYYKKRLVYQGKILEIKPDKKSGGQFFTAYGYWKNGHRKYRNKSLEFNYVRLNFSLVKWFLDINLRDQFNSPIYHVYANLGSPDSYASGNGMTIEYLKFYRVSRISYGSFKSSRNILTGTPKILIKTVAYSYGALLGQQGSQLYLGSSVALTKADVSPIYEDNRSELFLSILPEIGLRITSEQNYVFYFDIMSNVGIGSGLEAFTGKLQKKTSIFNAKNVSSVVGMGFGL